MTSLVRSLGPSLTAAVLVLTGIWIVGMIVAPQLIMLEKSFWHWDRGGDAGALSVRIDNLYNDIGVLDLDKADAEALEPSAERDLRLAEIERQVAATKVEIAELEIGEVEPRKVYSFSNYTRMGAAHFAIFVKTILAALAVTIIAFLVCYPIAYAVAKLSPPGKAAVIMLGLIVPYAINELLRTFAWLMILNTNGVANAFLAFLGMEPVRFLESGSGVFIAMVYAYVLFMVFPIYNTVETLDIAQVEAARDLGAPMWKVHWRVVLPHAKPGIVVGSVMTFMLSAGSYAVPYVMTRGTASPWFTQLIYNKFFESNNWNAGAAYAFTLLTTCTLFILLLMQIFKVGIKDIAR